LASVFITVMHMEGGMKYSLQCSCFIMRMERKPRRVRLKLRSLDVRNLELLDAVSWNAVFMS